MGGDRAGYRVDLKLTVHGMKDSNPRGRLRLSRSRTGSDPHRLSLCRQAGGMPGDEVHADAEAVDDAGWFVVRRT